ncbi:hypothetical protein ACHQM5_012775 [Ranunculus cassubicifolius]
MAKPKNNISCITISSQMIPSLSASSLQTLLLSPKKPTKQPLKSSKKHYYFLIFLFLFSFLGMLKLTLNLDPFTATPCFISPPLTTITTSSSSSVLNLVEKTEYEDEFWKQPNGLGYRPCLEFSKEYRDTSLELVKDRTKYLMVVVSGGMNQQRNQIVDAVVIARILGAALVFMK